MSHYVLFVSYWCLISTILASCLMRDIWRWLYYLKVHWLSFIDSAHRHATYRLPSSCNFANPDGANICLPIWANTIWNLHIWQCGQINVIKSSKQFANLNGANICLCFFQLFSGSLNICEQIYRLKYVLNVLFSVPYLKFCSSDKWPSWTNGSTLIQKKNYLYSLLHRLYVLFVRIVAAPFVWHFSQMVQIITFQEEFVNIWK